MPTVSIIMATYNRSNYVGEAIESVLAQDFKDWELVLVNDGSTDDTEEIVRSYTQVDPRIRYFRKENERNLALVRNFGLARAKGDFVAFLDDDDRWLPNKLSRQISLMEFHPEIGMCYTRFQVYRSDETGLVPTKSFPEFLAVTFEELFLAFVPPSTVLMRKSCLDQTGWFDPQYRLSEDFDMWIRFSQRWKVAAIDEALTFTVMDGRNHEGKDPMKVWKATAEIVKNLQLIPEYANRKGYVKLQFARRIYEGGRIYCDLGQYWMAAIHFARAIWIAPLVGMAVRRSGEKAGDILIRILKAYVAVPICIFKGLIHGRH